MNKKNKLKIILILLILIILSFVYIIEKEKNNEKIIQTDSQIIELSTKKVEWGIKKNKEHLQPDVGIGRKELLEKYKGICFGNENEKTIYLTFDEGYEAGYTSEILDILKNNQIPATFFITAHYLNTSSELVQRMLEEGHIVGNHTVNHKSLPTLNSQELEKEIMDLHQAVYEKFAYEMNYIRPPKGEVSESVLNQIQNLGYRTVMWSFAYCDWNEKNQPNEEQSKNNILENLHNGEIMLLHGNSKTNLNILDSLIKEIKNQGYEIKSLDEFK